MLPLQTLGAFTFPDGRELVLYHRDGTFQIRIDGLELMTSRAHGSEAAMAGLAREALRGAGPRVIDQGGTGGTGPRVLVGGLGMGYTLRAVLDSFPKQSQVVVSELLPTVVEWNRGPLAHLAGRPLDDPRVRVVEHDVAALIAEGVAGSGFDAILLDVDNGPGALTQLDNATLYQSEGLGRIHAALRPGGVLAVWSAADDRDFELRLRTAGFEARSEKVSARGNARGPKHTVFLGITRTSA